MPVLFILVLISKIVFDWLINRNARAGTVSKQLLCKQEYDTLRRNLATIDNKVCRMDSCLIREKMKIVSLKIGLAAPEKRLDQGRKDFKEIKADVANINTNIAVLLERSKGHKSIASKDK